MKTPKQVLEENAGAFETYKKELLLWNEKFNLTAITDSGEVDKKHFLDSLSLLEAIPSDKVKLIDIGSGAGFPGIPLALALPESTVSLLEATNKKCTFLNHIKDELKLSNLEVICARAEEAGRHPDLRESYDIATGRAVAKLSVLVEYAFPLLKVGGLLIAQKDKTKENFADADVALKTLGGEIEQTIELKETERVLVLIRKKVSTSSEFPRLPGFALKKPL